MAVKFTKMHGLGNDFVMFNAVAQSLDLSPELARKFQTGTWVLVVINC